MCHIARSPIVLVCMLLWPPSPARCDEPSVDVLVEDSFETGDKGPDGWREGPAIPGVKYVYDRRLGSDGQRSLSLQKSANKYFPIAAWTRTFPRTGDKPVLKVTAQVKATKATKAIIDAQFLDAGGNVIKHEWVAYIGQKDPSDRATTHNWKEYRGTAEIPPNTKQITIELQIYGPGNVWFDDLQARYVDPATKADAVKKGADNTDAAKRDSAGAAAVDIPAPIEITLPSHAMARYLLVPASTESAQPANGYPLLIALPGGAGDANFHPFLRSVHEEALGGRFVMAQALAPPQTVWPTNGSRARWATTEEAIAAIIADVSQRQSIDRQSVYALAWSSSGPAVYATLLQKESPLAGALVAMSVFKPAELPPLANAAGRRLYLLHSPQDQVCPYPMAQAALDKLTSAGAQVTLVDYQGGHGWHGAVYENIRAGITWLEHPR